MENQTEIKTTKAEFEPQFLYRKENQVNAMLTDYDNQVNSLNKAIEAAEDLLSRNLSEDEKKAMHKGKGKFVIDEVESKFQFPKADRQFNLTALGLDPKPFEDAYAAARNAQQYVYALEDGVYKTLDAYKASLASRFDVYTKNERQNEALKLATDLLELIEKIKENGFTFGMLPTLVSGNPLISMEGQERIPSFQTIQKL